MSELRRAGSLHDPESGLIDDPRGIVRFFRPAAAAGFGSAVRAGLITSLVDRGAILPFETVSGPGDELRILQPALPFVSYPYEWTFGMLRASGLLQLDILLEALEAGFILKDGSAYNVSFDGTRPVFLDLGSISAYEPGQPWAGYTQFCRTVLNPLLLTAETGVPFHPWLRGSASGISEHQLRSVLGIRSKMKRAVLTNVVLQDALQSPSASVSTARVPIPKSSLQRVIRQLRSTVEKLKPRSRSTAWVDYEDANSYAASAERAKEAAVAAHVERVAPHSVWDLGSNRGRYSLIAAKHAKVISIEADPWVADQLYERALASAKDAITPVVMDLADPSPEQGWAHGERSSLTARGPADLALCLALIHHLRFTATIPLAEILAWLSTIARGAIVEFVPKDDPMVTRLLAGRRDVFDDYTVAEFERAASSRFRIDRREALPDSSRALYVLDAITA